MAKTIKLKMENDKTIKIYVNEEEKYSIPKDERTITADKIYEVIGFTNGEHYDVITENEYKNDEQVMDFFVQLFMDIIDKVNALSKVEPSDNILDERSLLDTKEISDYLS